MPYVAIKTAVTLDSKIATNCFNSKWITGQKARLEVMKLRNSYQAIMTGSNTVKADNPKLTARIENGINPIRIIMDRSGILDENLNVFKKNTKRIIVINNTDKKYKSHIEKIKYKSMKKLMKDLYSMGIYSILIEAGGRLNGEFIKNKLADEVYQFIAPKILGGGINFINGLDPIKLSDAVFAKDLNIEKYGEDILLNYSLEY